MLNLAWQDSFVTTHILDMLNEIRSTILSKSNVKKMEPSSQVRFMWLYIFKYIGSMPLMDKSNIICPLNVSKIKHYKTTYKL